MGVANIKTRKGAVFDIGHLDQPTGVGQAAGCPSAAQYPHHPKKAVRALGDRRSDLLLRTRDP